MHFKCLTGMRCFAALLVIISHYHNGKALVLEINGSSYEFWPQIASSIGMTIFFILSGVVIHLNYRQHFKNLAFDSVFDFFFRRFARLFPMLFFGFVVTLAVSNTTSKLNETVFLNYSYLLLTPAFSWLPFFINEVLQIQFIYGMSWSISTEIFFYFIYPLTAYFFLNILIQKRVILLVLLALYLIPFSIFYYIFSHPTETLSQFEALTFIPSITDKNIEQEGLNSLIRWTVYVSPYGRVFEFLMGVSIAELTLRRIKLFSKSSYKIEWLCIILFIIFYVLLIFGNIDIAKSYFGTTSFFHFLHQNILFSPLICIIIYLQLNHKTITRRLCENPLVLKLGEISYSLYINHIYLTWIFNWRHANGFFSYIEVLVGITITILLSFATFEFIEKPVKKYLIKIYEIKKFVIPIRLILVFSDFASFYLMLNIK